MTTQIAVRIPDELVAFVDDVVRSGEAKSRAEIVLRALLREQRLIMAQRDLAILTKVDVVQPQTDDLDELVTWTSENPIDVDAD